MWGKKTHTQKSSGRKVQDRICRCQMTCLLVIKRNKSVPFPVMINRRKLPLGFQSGFFITGHRLCISTQLRETITMHSQKFIALTETSLTVFSFLILIDYLPVLQPVLSQLHDSGNYSVFFWKWCLFETLCHQHTPQKTTDGVLWNLALRH